MGEIHKALVTDFEKKEKIPYVELNLTQLMGVDDLILKMMGVKEQANAGAVPLVFFDEFDAPLAGRPLGWLAWFLAPMQDGTFFLRGAKVALNRAIFVFAGGTASAMAEFSGRADADFRAAKGPDFVSRLRGYLDVLGPNHPEQRDLRREGVILQGLKKVEQARTGDKDAPPRKLSPELKKALLDVGRFRHGARSIHAILEMAAARSPVDPCLIPPVLTRGDLPDDHVLAVHADLGPLEPEAIGGLVAMSGGGTQGESEVRDRTWRRIARML